jgi:hypothetical protein
MVFPNNRLYVISKYISTTCNPSSDILVTKDGLNIIKIIHDNTNVIDKLITDLLNGVIIYKNVLI